MKKNYLLLCIIGACISIPVFSQSLRFEAGKKHVDTAGYTSYASAASLIKIMNPMTYMSLVKRGSQFSNTDEFFVVISLPIENIDKVSEDSSLRLDLANGETLELPVNEKVEWDSGTAPKKKSTEVYLIDIPYRITPEQIEVISSTAVKKVSVPGIDKTITFSPKGAIVSNVMKRQFKEVKDLASGVSSTQTIAHNKKSENIVSNKTMSGKGPSAKYIIHDTPATKVITVHSLNNLVLSPVREDAFFVCDQGTGETTIFDKKGNQLASLNLAYSDRKEINYWFVDGKALVSFADGEMAIINSRGKVLNDLRTAGNLSSYEGFSQFTDGIALVYVATGRRDPFTGYLPGDYKYLGSNGKLVRPDLSFNHMLVDGEPYTHPLRDGRRLHEDRKYGKYGDINKYGYLDADGNTVIDFQFEGARDFSEGLAAVATKRGNEILWGFIDIHGNWVIEPMFSNMPDDFHEGFAIVQKKNNNYVFIDMSGKVCSSEYTNARRFFNGMAMVSHSSSHSSFIDHSFAEKSLFCPLKQSSRKVVYCDETNTLFFPATSYSPFQVYSSSGELLIESISEPFYTDLSVYHIIGESGYVNLKGEIVLKFVENEF